MEPTVDLDEITLRAQRHWIEDGSAELMLGLLMFGQMGVYMTAFALPEGPVMDFVRTFGAQALVLAITLSIVFGFKRLKARITFPRTGYVAIPKPTWKYRFSVWGVFVLIAGALSLTELQPSGTERASWIAVPAFALVLGGACIGGGLKYKQPTMLWEGFFTVLLAVYVNLFTSLRGIDGVAVLMILVGSFMAIMGGFRLRRFLKTNPRPQETEA
jgi:uncharacterized membrane protein HdeD (DUF308 family)